MHGHMCGHEILHGHYEPMQGTRSVGTEARRQGTSLVLNVIAVYSQAMVALVLETY
jgi:hypothetical protein